MAMEEGGGGGGMIVDMVLFMLLATRGSGTAVAMLVLMAEVEEEGTSCPVD
jgi:hypothetical protein